MVQLTQAAPPRSMLRLMFDRSIGGLFWGKVFTTTGLWMHSVVAAVVVFDRTGSALLVGLISAAQFVPQVLLAPWAGSLADRGYGREQVLASRMLCVVASCGLAVAVWAYGLAGPHTVGILAAASVGVGLGFALGGPPMQAFMPDLVRPDELSAAMALNSAPMTIARVTGPVVGALIIAPWGPVAAFTTVAAFHVLFFFLLLFVVRLPHRPRTAHTRRGHTSNVRMDRRVVALLAVVALATAAAEPTLTFGPALAASLGGDADDVGIFSAVFGIGALVGVGFAPRLMRARGNERVVSAGLVLLCASLIAIPATDVFDVVLAGLAFGGIGFSLCVSAATTLIQQQTPAQIRGRVMAWWLVGFVGARPLGGAVFGAIADMTTIDIGFLASGAVALGATMIGRLLPRETSLDEPVASCRPRG